MKPKERGGEKPEQVTADLAYDILQELKAINAKLDVQTKKRWVNK